MKKAISLLLTLVLCLSLVACGGGETAQNPYEKYEELFLYLESNDYDNANAYIQNYFGMTEDALKENQNESAPAESTPPATEPQETEPADEVIEITLNNWQDYFELRMVAVEQKNDFDELVCFYPNMNLCLKEEWADLVTDMEVAVEFSCTDGYMCWFTYNTDTGEVTEGEVADNAGVTVDINETFTMKDYHIESGKNLFGGVHSNTFTLEENIATIRGTMYTNVEILRIQGSITITR